MLKKEPITGYLPFGLASKDLVNQVKGKTGSFYKPEDKNDRRADKGYTALPPNMNEVPDGWVRSGGKHDRYTFVIAKDKQGKECLFAMGDIHIRYRWFIDAPLGLVVQTFVHEATHKFANLSDIGPDRGYFSYSNVDFKPSLTPADALHNADSYAWLVYYLSNGDDANWS